MRAFIDGESVRVSVQYSAHCTCISPYICRQAPPQVLEYKYSVPYLVVRVYLYCTSMSLSSINVLYRVYFKCTVYCTVLVQYLYLYGTVQVLVLQTGFKLHRYIGRLIITAADCTSTYTVLSAMVLVLRLVYGVLVVVIP